MKKNVLRVLACLLCVLLVLPVVPANAAENTAAQPRDLTQNDYGDYWFTTLEELKTLAGMTFDRQTWAYYVGEDALVISEDLTLPENCPVIPFSAEKGNGRDELVRLILSAVKE